MTEENKDLQVVDWEAEFAKSTELMLKSEKPSTNFISFRAGVISYDGNVVHGNKVNVVIVGSAFENNWYPYQFDPNNVRSPECWAISLAEEDMSPPDSVNDKQSDSCATCPLNEWVDGKKECKNIRRLALFPESQLATPEMVNIMLAKLPVTSVKNWRKYVENIGNMTRRPIWAVVTELSTTPDPKTQFKVNFTAVRMLEEAELKTAHKFYQVYQGENTSLLAGYDPNDDEAPPPAAAAPQKQVPGSKSKPKF